MKTSKKANSHLNFDILDYIFTKSKRSQGHVEIILATTLFVGFIIFIFIFLNSSLKTTKEIPTQKIQDAILEQTQEEIGKLSIVLGPADLACIKENEINRVYGNDYTYIIESGFNNKRYTFYYGQSFTQNRLLDNCAESNKDYTTGAYLEEKIIFEEKIIDLKNAYRDYSKLKQDLGVDNFAFEFTDLEGNRIEELSVIGKIPDSVDVISKDFPVRVINKDADTSELILNIKAWQ